jgi:hypothetical protein
MSTVQTIPRSTPRLRLALSAGLAALGVAVAVVVAILILTTSTKATRAVAAQPQTASCGDVCSAGGYAGPGRRTSASVSHVVITPTGYAHGGIGPASSGTGHVAPGPPYVRAEHSYGLVP